MEFQLDPSKPQLQKLKIGREAKKAKSQHLSSTTSCIRHLQWHCATQTEPEYSLGRSLRPNLRTLSCSHTAIQSQSLLF